MSAKQNHALLEVHHQAALAKVQASPVSLATLASMMGVDQVEASHRLMILVDEGLVTLVRDVRGKPTGQYQLA